MRALGIKGLAAVLLGFDPELGHLRPSASDQACQSTGLAPRGAMLINEPVTAWHRL